MATNLEHDDECDIKLVVSDIFIPFHFGRAAAVGTGRILSSSCCLIVYLIFEKLNALVQGIQG